MTPAQLRAVARSFPEAEEVETWDQATFRVRKKMFCILGGGASLKGGPGAAGGAARRGPARRRQHRRGWPAAQGRVASDRSQARRRRVRLSLKCQTCLGNWGPRR